MNLQDYEPPTFREDKKKGYLYQDFRYFHLKDQIMQDYPSHCHDFYKIVGFLSGNVTYMVEGKAYFLKPGDILLINRYDLHRPVIDSRIPYERIILWLRLDFIRRYQKEGCSLGACFGSSTEKRYPLIRLEPPLKDQLLTLLLHLEDALNSREDAFGYTLMSQTLLIQFLIQLNRIYLGNSFIRDSSILKADKRIEEIIRYINIHISNDLSAQRLSQQFYISRSYLMKKFKEETGYSLHQYIIQKRLFLAADLIRDGSPSTKAAIEAGFSDYSVFLKAFKKLFHCLPSKY